MKGVLLFCLLNLLLGVGWAETRRMERVGTEKGFVTVHYPDSFDEARTYSVLFWFHGTGGRPNAGIGRGHERFISVGMSYLKRDQVPAEDYGGAHWRECLAVREALVAEGLKLDRNVVAGMSKGGWMSFYIASEVRGGLHAVGIFAAGKDPNVKSVEQLGGLSVLVGTGETDPNFPQAQLAVKVLEEAGAEVFYQEWLGEGHVYHSDGRVRDWLDVESRRSDPVGLLEFCEDGVLGELERIRALELVKDRYVGLRLLAGDPRLVGAGDEVRREVRELGRELAIDDRVREWRGGLDRLRKLVGREVVFFDRRDFDVSKLDKLVGAYRKLLGEVGHVDLAARAAYGYRRAAKMSAIYTEQMKAREEPEYSELMEEYVKLQTKYGEAGGKPGEAVIARLREVGARLGELRHEAGMGAFLEVESGGVGDGEIPEIGAAIEAAAGIMGSGAFGGLGF